ncbi:MAG: Sensor histidine kinase WalK [Firmicutes bacterium]|nr:Sensor histidine kinase WalK [Bacillota bacterium]
MRISLRLRLPLTYLLVIAMAVGGSGLIMSQFLREHFLSERRAALLIQSSIIANSAREAMLDPGLDLGRMTRTFAEQLRARVIILDTSGLVLADAFDELTGHAHAHPALPRSLQGKTEVMERRSPAGQATLYVLAPIYRDHQSEGVPTEFAGRAQIGVVFIASSLDDVYASLDLLERRLVVGSAAVAFIAASMGLGLASSITAPLLALTQVAGRMSDGEETAKVYPSGDQEVYELGAAFNQMSSRVRALEQARMRFISDASHEMRAPLAAMKALVDPLVADPRINADIRQELLLDLTREIDRLSTLVADLLQLARLDSRMALVREPCDIANLTRRVVASLAALAKTKRVSVTTNVPKGLPYVGDAAALHRAIFNIVDNAIKFADSAVHIALSSTPEGLLLSVVDDGPGIPSEAKGRIFERFYRVDESRTRATGGSGLGLAIAYEVVQAHGGSIRVETAHGHGATFLLSLPTPTTHPA